MIGYTFSRAWHRDQEAALWARLKADARKLPRQELLRHASVSRDNRHRCQSCFTCACLTVAEEAGIKGRDYNV